ncbi:MAG: ACP S-malonyltransferase, partial [Proteobacteria bacterium]
MGLGVVFPGQGSQRVGMLAEAAAEFASVKDAFTEASDALGYDLWTLVSNGPEDQLSLTEFTQPAILTA